ncbi:MAG: trypsin-like serine protease [Archangium sp.]
MRSQPWVLTAAALVMLMSCGVPLDEDETAPQIGVRRDGIVGGHVSWGYPQVFSLFMAFNDGSAGTCTSTLVGRRTLLTASHCVRNDTKRLGATYVDATNATDARRRSGKILASQWVANPLWISASDTDESNFDVAMVQLEREPFVRPITWNTDMLDLSWRGRTVEATGYGVQSTTGSDSDIKHNITIPIQSVASATLVTGTNVPLAGTCFGDSGGPILANFADGKRVIGVNSKTRMAECGPGTSTRPDANDAFIRATFEQYETASCLADQRCQTVGCATPDPDCACVDDGVCSTACVAPGSDPDCASACGRDGVCAAVSCSFPDFDCALLGAPCGRDAHCASRVCRDSPQHPEPYCTQTCDTSTPCPTGFECNAGVCRYPILPTAAIGEACTATGTLCEGTEAVCVVITSQGPDPKCRQRCFENDDCGRGMACVLDATGDKACGAIITAPRGDVVTLPAGCSSAPALLGALALLLLRRRRA